MKSLSRIKKWMCLSETVNCSPTNYDVRKVCGKGNKILWLMHTVALGNLKWQDDNLSPAGITMCIKCVWEIPLKTLITVRSPLLNLRLCYNPLER